MSATVAEQQGDGWEAAARAARYEFLRETAERIGHVSWRRPIQPMTRRKRCCTDSSRQPESRVLPGIRRVRRLTASVVLVRPMLILKRTDVLEYLSSNGKNIEWMRQIKTTDGPVADCGTIYCPSCRHYNPRVDAALTRLATQANEAQELIMESPGWLLAIASR